MLGPDSYLEKTEKKIKKEKPSPHATPKNQEVQDWGPILRSVLIEWSKPSKTIMYIYAGKENNTPYTHLEQVIKTEIQLV